MNYVLDACAIIAYLKGEPGGNKVESFLRDPSTTCFVHSINLCEAYYDFLRRHDEPTADRAILDVRAVGVIERHDMGWPFVSRVGRLKARGRISLADC